MSTAFWILIFVLSLAVLLYSSKTAVEACEKITKAMGLSSFVAGITVLAIGTSLPEVTTGLWATLHDKTTFVASTVVGSNIANILFILGLGAVVNKRIQMNQETSTIGILLGSSFLLFVSLYDGKVTWYEGILLLSIYAIYALHIVEEHKAGRLDTLKNWLLKETIDSKIIGKLMGSLVLLGVSSYGVMIALENVAGQTHIMPGVLGASLLALGTSLPELSTSMFAFKKGENDLALGALVGSNIFNASFVLGLPALLHTLTVGNDVIVLGIPFLLMATLLLIFATIQRKITAHEGAIYLLLYTVFSFQLLTSF